MLDLLYGTPVYQLPLTILVWNGPSFKIIAKFVNERAILYWILYLYNEFELSIYLQLLKTKDFIIIDSY